MKINNLLFSFMLLGAIIAFNGCKKDACESIVCLNGGTCANGTCNCADGYEGSDCSITKTPTSVIISKITLTRMPATDNGTGWDPFSSADILIEIDNLTTSSNVYQSGVYNDSDASLSYEFTLNLPVGLNASTQYQIDLFDEDGVLNDWMGGIIFYPFSSTDGFPTTMTLDAGGDVAFVLELSYTF